MLRLQEQARLLALEKTALQGRAEAAEAKVLDLQLEAREHAAAAGQAREGTAELQRRAEECEAALQRQAAEERVLELQREAAPSYPALMRAVEGVGAVVAGMELRELLVLDGALAAAAETVRAERAERARQMPERFLCPISQALPPPPPSI